MAPLPKVGHPVIASRRFIPSISVSLSGRCDASAVIAMAFLNEIPACATAKTDGSMDRKLAP
jgi:hypothetical protein